MGRRDDLVAVFEDTMRHLEAEPLAGRVRGSCAGTRIFAEDEPLESLGSPEKTEVSVTLERSFEAARRLRSDDSYGRVAVLNFASPTTPGGGVTRGSTAQEECLCRCSTLYPALDQGWLWDGFYKPNRARRDTLATDVCIWVPDVVVFKEDGYMPTLMDERSWFSVDVITAAAPNLRRTKIADADLHALHVRRAKRILEVASSMGTDALVGGAFGCGAFANDPYIVADAWAEALSQASGLVGRVVFAVWCPPRDTTNYDAFASRFSRWG